MGQRKVSATKVSQPPASSAFYYVSTQTMTTAQAARLRYQPEALAPLLEGLTDGQFRQQPQPGKWSIFEQLAHLGRYQQVFSDRLRQISQLQSPPFSRYVAEEDPAFDDWLTRPLDDLLNRLEADRTELTQWLSACSADILRRTGRHPLFGNMTIEQWTEFFLLHEAHHLFAIMKLAARFRQ